MTASTGTLAPGSTDTSTTGVTAPGTGVSTETLDKLTTGFRLSRDLDELLGPGSRGSATRTAVERATLDPDVFGWLAHIRAAAGCSNPVRLSGAIEHLDATTGAVLSRQETADMPDGVLYKACGNRRASVCPHCAEIYRADAYQLIRAGMIGGKGVDPAVAAHPGVFPTFTAPSFGLVHGTRQTKTGQPAPCRARRHPELCPHGVDLRCPRVHAKGEHILGQPLCMDCYDYDGQAVWNLYAGELWRRTTEGIKRYLNKMARRIGAPEVRARACKVAEFQARGVVHFHAVMRLDAYDRDDPAAVLPCPAGLDVVDLVDAVHYAARATRFRTPPHPDRPEGWLIEWGKQVDVIPLRVRADQEITDELVAGYFAKYATKSTEATGHVSRRLNSDTIDLYTGQDPRLKRPHGPTHTERLIDACWTLGGYHQWTKLRRWAHMLGFGGHFLTKSRAYSVTFRTLRNRRVIWRRIVDEDQAATTDGETTLIVGTLTYAGTGWHTLGDAMLANTSADLARHRARIAREEYAHLIATSR
jgi:hypothetical protein